MKINPNLELNLLGESIMASIQYYGQTDISAEITTDITQDGPVVETARIRASQRENGIVFYTSHNMVCAEKDLVNAQMVAEAALEHHRDWMDEGLGTYVNRELEEAGFN